MSQSCNENSQDKRSFEFGDLTQYEIHRIQKVVDEAGRPLDVVGSAASGERGEKNEIDYVVGPCSIDYYRDLAHNLPSIDPNDGIIPGTHNPHQGPAIRFEPCTGPRYIPAI
jgi:hypothetical protein